MATTRAQRQAGNYVLQQEQNEVIVDLMQPKDVPREEGGVVREYFVSACVRGPALPFAPSSSLTLVYPFQTPGRFGFATVA